MESRTPILTRTEIDTMVDPAWLSLYYDLWGEGIIANDEAPEQWQAFGQATNAMQDVIRDAAGEAHSSLSTLEVSGSDLANTLFEEGFKRGIALTVWMQDKPEDDRTARPLTPTQWFVSGKLLDSALRK